MSSTLEKVLDIEIEETLNMLEEQEDSGNIQITSFSWKYYNFIWKGDTGVAVIDTEHAPKHERMFTDWKEAMYAVKGWILERHHKQ